jgi:uncharacterized protein YndB with AHSA1/START domain
MTTTTTNSDTGTRTVQVHRVYIHAPAQRVWDALLSPEWTDRYGYGGFVQSDLQPGSPFAHTAGTGMQEHGVTGPVVDGKVIESDPPRRFVQTWRMLMDDALKAEGFTRLTYELVETSGVTRLTLTHDVTGAPQTAWLISGESDAQPDAGGGGWPWVLSDLKSLLETGTAFSRAG